MNSWGKKADGTKASVLAEALDKATGKFLENNKSPGRKVHELDNRGSHFYLTMYWAKALAEQSKDIELQNKFKKLADALRENEGKILIELNSAQGKPMDIGGYYRPNKDLAFKAMRPSETFNSIMESL